MSKRVLLCVVTVLACGALTGVEAAAAHGGTATKVTIVGPDHVYGKIKSSKKKCLGGRTVKVYKQKGSAQNPKVDQKVASTKSERRRHHGEWDLGNPGFKHGKYYAKATKSTGCKAGYSKTVHF